MNLSVCYISLNKHDHVSHTKIESLVSVCYHGTNVSPGFPCVTVKLMLVYVFRVLLVTHGRFTYRRTNIHTYIQTDNQLFRVGFY